jgi:hypothetical protein
MPLWVLTIAICVAVWIVGTIVVVLGAMRLIRRPD